MGIEVAQVTGRMEASYVSFSNHTDSRSMAPEDHVEQSPGCVHTEPQWAALRREERSGCGTHAYHSSRQLSSPVQLKDSRVAGSKTSVVP